MKMDRVSAEFNPMPAISTATATALLMLAHSFVGCCWHHGHPHGGHVAHAQIAAQHERGESVTPYVSHGDHPVGDSECQEGPCTYVKVKRTSLALAASPLANGAVVADGVRGASFASRTADDSLSDDPAQLLRAGISVWLL
jgi:hypothetical protein